MSETLEKPAVEEIDLPIVIVGFHFAGRMMCRWKVKVLAIAEIPEQREYFGNDPIVLHAFDANKVEIIER